MRYPALLLALAGVALLTACSTLISLNPLVADGQAIVDPALAGTWKGADADAKFLMVIQQKGALYAIHYSEENSGAFDFVGRLVRVGDAELMDIVSTRDDALAVQVHMVARVWSEAGTLKFVFLDSDWLRSQANQTLATQPAGDRTLITAPGDPAIQFLKKYGADARAYSDKPNALVKVK